jgi:endonuclease-3 related protein
VPATKVRGGIIDIYRRLHHFFGPQHWWPGETPFEVAVGAILTQNTNWGNVEKAIANLKRDRKLSPRTLHRLSADKLSLLIRQSGYYTVKAKRLKYFADFLMEEYGGSMERMKGAELADIRPRLLHIHGIGPETADSIILYALEKPVFVVDAYTKRVLSRHRLMAHDSSYEAVQEFFHSQLRRNVSLYNEFHALFVRLAKENCRKVPLCGGCPLEGM